MQPTIHEKYASKKRIQPTIHKKCEFENHMQPTIHENQISIKYSSNTDQKECNFKLN